MPISGANHLALRLWRWIALVGLMAVAWPGLAQAAPPGQAGGDGEALFNEKCIACHTIGAGRLVGPDLQGVTERRDQAWISAWILAPDKMLAASDPIAVQLLAEANNVPMPNLGLTEAQVAALIAYLAGSQGTTVALPEAALPAGDPSRGRALFTGTDRMQNGGPPCMGCHSIAGLGTLGGGALGPDLTPAISIYGDAGLVSFLNTVPTVTMNAVWTRQPLTPDEQADLWTFIKQASIQERPPGMVWQLAGLAVAGTLLLLVLAQVYWRKRLVSVRKPLVARARIS